MGLDLETSSLCPPETGLEASKEKSGPLVPHLPWAGPEGTFPAVFCPHAEAEEGVPAPGRLPACGDPPRRLEQDSLTAMPSFFS